MNKTIRFNLQWMITFVTLTCTSCTTTTNANTPVQTTASTEQVVQSDANTPTEQEEASLFDATVTVAHTDITSAFTDPAFLAVIQRLTANQVLYADEIASITTLEINDIEIRSLAGLEHLVGLEQLEVTRTSIEQMTLPELPSLHQLAVSDSAALQTLTLPSLPTLRELVVFENEALRTLSLPSLPALQTLVVHENAALRTLSLPSLPALQTLRVADNNALNEFSLPPTLSNLQYLEVGDDVMLRAIETRWAEIAPHLESLEILRLTQTHRLTLPALPALQELVVSDNNALNDLSLPPTLSNLQYLEVGGDVMLRAVETRWAEIAPHLESLQISNLTQTHLTLPEFPILQTLRVGNNAALRTLTLLSLPALQSLDVFENHALRTLSLSSLPALQELGVLGNDALRTLSLSSLPALQSLKVSWNDALRTLSLSSLPALQELGVLGNDALRTLSLSSLPALQSLKVSSSDDLNDLSLPPSLSNLRHLEVGDDVMLRAIETRWAEIAPHLESLKIYGRTQTHLTLPSLPKLHELEVSWNDALQTLTLPSLPALQELEMYSNDALSTLSLPSLPALESLYVKSNNILSTLSLANLPALQMLDVYGNDALSTLTLPPSLSNLRFLSVDGDVMLQAIEARWAEIAPHLESLQISWLTQTHLTLPELPALQELRVTANDALQTLTFTGALGSASINTEVYLYDNAPRSLAAFNQIVQHQDATIRSSLGQGDVLRVDEELIRDASVLRNAGVDVQAY